MTAARLEEVLASGAFGAFLVLVDGDGFMQTDLDLLEYRDAASGRLFRVEGPTFEQVRLGLLSYLARGADWRNFDWHEFHL